MSRRIESMVAVFLGLSLLTGAGNLSAAPYYEGKVINIIVGYGPGVSAEETLKTMTYLLAQPPEIVKEFSKYIKF